MPSHRFLPDEDQTKQIRKMNHVVELERRKHLLLTALKGIAMYAHRARQFTLTDREIDRFTVETLDLAVSDQPMGLERIRQLLDDAEEMRDRAKRLYHWACELFSKPPEHPDRPTSPDPRQLLFQHEPAQPSATGKRGPLMCREQLYWEGVCAQKLNMLAQLAIFQLESGTLAYDICGMVHEQLDYLSKDLSIFNLIDLAVFLDDDPIALLQERVSQRVSPLLTVKKASPEMDLVKAVENY